jgi:hypothetical protein
LATRLPDRSADLARREHRSLLRSVIGAVVQGTRRRENPSLGCGHRFSGWSPEAVQFFKSLQGDSTKAYRSASKAFCETAVREPTAALVDELSGEFGSGRIACPAGTYGSGKPPDETAAWPRVMRAGRWPA